MTNAEAISTLADARAPMSLVMMLERIANTAGVAITAQTSADRTMADCWVELPGPAPYPAECVEELLRFNTHAEWPFRAYGGGEWHWQNYVPQIRAGQFVAISGTGTVVPVAPNTPSSRVLGMAVSDPDANGHVRVEMRVLAGGVVRQGIVTVKAEP